MKPTIFKHGDAWVLVYPGYGFSEGCAVAFSSWREAVARATLPAFQSGISANLELSPSAMDLDDSI